MGLRFSLWTFGLHWISSPELSISEYFIGLLEDCYQKPQVIFTVMRSFPYSKNNRKIYRGCLQFYSFEKQLQTIKFWVSFETIVQA